MSAESVEKWLRSGKYAQVNGTRLRPVEHSGMKGTPFSIQRGQAEAFRLVCDKGKNWILKKFHKGKNPDYKHLVAVASLLPKHDAFLAGTDRQILSSTILHKAKGFYYTAELAEWLDGTVRMPQIPGIDWATLADEIREGRIKLNRPERIELARRLTELILLLEKYNLCHRDISSGNVFIVIQTWKVCLIDFDSLYHPSLSMPQSTTCGTAGYTPPFTWKLDKLDAQKTWCPFADRYALAIIIVEFLSLDRNAPLTSEGGMFNQDELRIGTGQGIDRIKWLLAREWQTVFPLFEAAIHSKDFATCPSPQDWRQVLDALSGPEVKPPRLEELENIGADWFEQMLNKARSATPLWPAPSLSDIPDDDFKLPNIITAPVSLPSDPWN